MALNAFHKKKKKIINNHKNENEEKEEEGVKGRRSSDERKAKNEWGKGGNRLEKKKMQPKHYKSNNFLSPLPHNNFVAVE